MDFFCLNNWQENPKWHILFSGAYIVTAPAYSVIMYEQVRVARTKNSAQIIEGSCAGQGADCWLARGRQISAFVGRIW
jgi:hypothetical protein